MHLRLVIPIMLISLFSLVAAGSSTSRSGRTLSKRVRAPSQVPVSEDLLDNSTNGATPESPQDPYSEDSTHTQTEPAQSAPPEAPRATPDTAESVTEPSANEPAEDSSVETTNEKANPPEDSPSEDGIVRNSDGDKIDIEQPTETEATTHCDCKFDFNAPYKQRRTSWGSLFSVGYSQYIPRNYEPDFVVQETYDSYYGSSPSMPLVELQLSLKKNFVLGAISLDLGLGYMNAAGKDATNLKMYPVRIGATYFMDSLFKNEPYVVPYGGGGIYSMVYREEQASKAVGGYTPISFYYNFGLAFQLDWIDEYADRSGYEENGLENTFFFIEGRGFLSAATPAPNFGSALHANLGLRLEF